MGKKGLVKITLVSFGFKYGIPNANYYFDVGFIKNPARETNWSFFSEPSAELREYVLNQENTRKFIDYVIPLIVFLSEIDQYQVFAFGCNAGRHRSSVLVDEIQRRLAEAGLDSKVIHRDLEGA